MMSVGIFLNGEMIHRFDVVNQIVRDKKDRTKYVTDDGRVIWHKRTDGAIVLAKKILRGKK